MCSLPPEYFDRIYAEDADPWGFESRPYEHEKYRATLAALPSERYQSAFEIGCSIGVLTEQLARRCASLLSVDVADAALERARERCRVLDWVRFERMRVPDEFPDNMFDLILLSEVGYYWSPVDLERARRCIVDHLVPGGHLLLVHWTPVVEDYPLTGDKVHEHMLSSAEPALRHRAGRREDLYRLDLFERTGT